MSSFCATVRLRQKPGRTWRTPTSSPQRVARPAAVPTTTATIARSPFVVFIHRPDDGILDFSRLRQLRRWKSTATMRHDHSSLFLGDDGWQETARRRRLANSQIECSHSRHRTSEIRHNRLSPQHCRRHSASTTNDTHYLPTGHKTYYIGLSRTGFFSRQPPPWT